MLLGNLELLNKEKAISIVGSRNCTEYGRKYATLFANELSQKEYSIVSGMAIGIDTAAHIGAVNNIGRTIAVLGCGFNKIFPEENEWLFHKIVKNCGCVISEYPPNVDASKERFPDRNRIVSGLSEAVLIVEAEHRSGTSITAGYAKEQEKIVCCLPSNIDSKCGIGTNKLIQQGAKLVTTSNEIIELIKGNENYYCKRNRGNKENKSTKKNNRETSTINEIKKDTKIIPKEYKFIYDIIKERQLHINEICKISNKNITQISGILTMMEIEDLIEQLPGNQYKIKE